MSDRLADIKARISVRNTLGIGRAETPYDEVAREVVWLVAEVERLHTHEYHWRIEVQALRDRVAELTRFNLDAGSEVRRLHGLCHDGMHQCACQGVATTVSGTLEMLATLRQRHAEAVAQLRGMVGAYRVACQIDPNETEDHAGHPLDPDYLEAQAWLASEAKAALERREP